jgi:hypothetical protein
MKRGIRLDEKSKPASEMGSILVYVRVRSSVEQQSTYIRISILKKTSYGAMDYTKTLDTKLMITHDVLAC